MGAEVSELTFLLLIFLSLLKFHFPRVAAPRAQIRKVLIFLENFSNPFQDLSNLRLRRLGLCGYGFVHNLFYLEGYSSREKWSTVFPDLLCVFFLFLVVPRLPYLLRLSKVHTLLLSFKATPLQGSPHQID